MIKQLTPEGFEKLKKELEGLKAQRKEIAARLKKAVSYGDLSENADYHQAKEDQGFLEGKIVELEDVLRNAQVIEKGEGIKGTIQIGSNAVLENKKGEEHITIVGAEEAAPMEGKISVESPLGKALMGKRKGDEVEINTPKGAIKYKVVKID